MGTLANGQEQKAMLQNVAFYLHLRYTAESRQKPQLEARDLIFLYG